MPSPRRSALLVTLILAGTACRRAPVVPTEAEVRVEQEPLVFFTGLAHGEQRLLFYSGEPQRFRVETKDGTVVADQVDEEQLARRFPELSELYESKADYRDFGYDR